MKTLTIVGFLALAGILLTAAFFDGSTAYAQASDGQLLDEISKIKKMVADLEAQLSSSRKMSAAGLEKTMKMLKDMAKTLDEWRREAPFYGD